MTFLASRAGHCEQPRLAQGQLRLLGTAQVDIPVDVAAWSSSVSPSCEGLSTLTLKILPPRKGAKGGCTVVVSATVSIEPWDSESGFSSRMVWRDGLEGCFGASADV